MKHIYATIKRQLLVAGILLSVMLVLAACTSGVQTPTADMQGQVATSVAATQSALPTTPPTPIPPQPTETTAPQKVTLRLGPDLQTIMQLPQSKLTLYTMAQDGTLAQRQEIPGGAGQTEFELVLEPGTYQVAAVYAPMEGFDLLSAYAADGSLVWVPVGAGQPQDALVLNRPPVPCAAGPQQMAEQLGLGAGYAQINSCPTGRIIFSFDPTVTNPPSAAVYATSEGMFSNSFSQDIASAANGTQFTLDVPPGDYTLTARSTTASDPSYFGVWSATGLALVRVEHQGTTTAFLAKPGDPCLAMFQLGATPDGRFPDTAAYQNLFHCGEGETASGEMGAAQMGRSADVVESFKDGSAWWLGEFDGYKFEVKNDAMVMEGDQTGLIDRWVTAPYKVKNFYMEGVFKVDDACGDWDRYGLLVRAPVPQYGYVFSVTCGGRFRLYYMEKGEKYVAIQEWKASDAIVTGPYATNRLGVWMDGKTIRLYINGKLVGEYTDQAFTEGIIGVHLGAVETAGFKVRVEEIQWWDLDK